MKTHLFDYSFYKYQIPDWNSKKNDIQSSNFERDSLDNFWTNRGSDNYSDKVTSIIHPELSLFCMEAQVSCSMSDAWLTSYDKGDHQTIHNHRSYGFSGIIYIEYDPSVHTPTCFVAPWQDPKTDKTILKFPDVQEGTMLIFPSYTLHFVQPNKSDKRRVILSFDLLPDEHCN